jgi:gas vesicle protein
MINRSCGFAFLTGVILGGLVGAGLGLLLAPCSGKETRDQVKVKGFEYKDRAGKGLAEVGHWTQEEAVTWQQKGQEILEKGRDSATEAIRHGKESLVEAVGHRKKNEVAESMAT